MTIGGALWRLPVSLPVRRERWELPDGDFLDIDRLEGPVPHAPLGIVLHGLEGSSRAGYVRGTLAQLRARGLAGLALNFRGCSGEPNRLARSYHSGETSDLQRVVDRLIGEAPGRALGLIGFSLGGNVAAKWLAEQGDRAPSEIRGVVAISPPLDLRGCALALDGSGFFQAIYRGRFLRSLRQKALGKARRFPEAIDARKARRSATFQAFDDGVIAPLNGFASAEAYWSESSAGPRLRSVKRPLHVIAALDDPFVPPAPIVGSPFVTAEIHACGGHVAFVTGTPWAPVRYAESRAVEVLGRWLEAVT